MRFCWESWIKLCAYDLNCSCGKRKQATGPWTRISLFPFSSFSYCWWLSSVADQFILQINWYFSFPGRISYETIDWSRDIRWGLPNYHDLCSSEVSQFTLPRPTLHLPPPHHLSPPPWRSWTPKPEAGLGHVSINCIVRLLTQIEHEYCQRGGTFRIWKQRFEMFSLIFRRSGLWFGVGWRWLFSCKRPYPPRCWLSCSSSLCPWGGTAKYCTFPHKAMDDFTTRTYGTSGLDNRPLFGETSARVSLDRVFVDDIYI